MQVSHKYEKSIFKNAKLEDSFSATRRELEEFKRKDVENAKAIKQVFEYLHWRDAVSVVTTLGRVSSWRVNISGCSASCKRR